MVASNRYENLYWFRPEPYIQYEKRSSACSSLKCSEVLTMGSARMVKEVIEPMLNEGQPEEKLQEPFCYGWNGRE
jgi:hypothetical protein